MNTLVSLLFIGTIPISTVKLLNFCYACLFAFFLINACYRGIAMVSAKFHAKIVCNLAAWMWQDKIYKVISHLHSNKNQNLLARVGSYIKKYFKMYQEEKLQLEIKRVILFFNSEENLDMLVSIDHEQSRVWSLCYLELLFYARFISGQKCIAFYGANKSF